jgi:lysophospholipase L1-like esterase
VSAARFERYVAIGDSSTEGLDDPDGFGGYRGWSQRLAERLAEVQGGLMYANLAVRGRTTRRIRDEQLGPALAMRPDLATVFSGTNDVLAWRFEPESLAADILALQDALVQAGATVLTFTLPDFSPLMPLARPLAPRILAMNAALRAAAARTGAIVVDFAAHPVAVDPRLWSDDRIHANARGHARIAEALAHALGLPGSSAAWQEPLPPRPPRSTAVRWGTELGWAGRHLAPWIARGLMGAILGGAAELPRRPKHSQLAPLPGIGRSAE